MTSRPVNHQTQAVLSRCFFKCKIEGLLSTFWDDNGVTRLIEVLSKYECDMCARAINVYISELEELRRGVV